MRAPSPHKITAMLDAALEAKRLPHALIFSGTNGSGREITSYTLAQDLLCLNSSGAKACLACDSCHALNALHHHGCDDSAHPDLYFLRPTNCSIKADDVRELITRAWMSPLLSRAKVFIIFDIDLIGNSGANILLKTLEEPPPQTFFILITSNPTQLLQTVRSRCQIFNFAPPTHTTESSHDHQRACALLKEKNFEGMRQVIVKGAQLSKKTISASERREFIQGFIYAFLEFLSRALRNSSQTTHITILAQQEVLTEALKDLHANVKLDLLIQALTIRLSRVV